MTADDPRPAGEAIRTKVDAMEPRVNEDGSINARHVAIEQTLRDRDGLPSYIAALDGPGRYRPAASGGATDGERETLTERIQRAADAGLLRPGCCGASTADDCHQRGLCWMNGAHPESPGYASRTAAPPVSQADGELREEIARLAEQWEDMARDHDEQGFSSAAAIYRAHARHLRRALDGQS